MELKDLEPYIKDDFTMEICGETFILGTTDDMEIPENLIEAVWCSENYTIYATPYDNPEFQVRVETYNQSLRDDEQLTIGIKRLWNGEVKTFSDYCHYVKQIATEIITKYEQKLKEQDDLQRDVDIIIADGRDLIEQQGILTTKYNRALAELDKQITENNRALSKAIAVRDAKKGDGKDGY